MTIKNRSIIANPWAYHTRQDGIRVGREGWRDQQDIDDGLNAARGIVHAMVLGMLVWAGVGIVVAFFMGWLK